MSNNITFVTALFNLGRDNIQEGFSRSFDHYLECFQKLLKQDINLTIFCDEEVENFVWKHRNKSNTHVVRKTLADLRNFPFYDKVQSIRTNKDWLNQAGWLAASPQAALELYNPLVMSKQFYLNDASIFNVFGTTYFAWIDAGLANTVNLDHYFGNPKFIKNLQNRMRRKMQYLAFPYDGNVEVHGFTKSAMNRYAGRNTEFVVRGGFFGGTRQAIAETNDMYYGMLNETINSGYMGTEESIFTLLAYKNPAKFNIFHLESNGLVYKFFEDVISDHSAFDENSDGSLAFYVLTYNLPKQFKLWVESFVKAYPKEFESVTKYVFNNSTDPAVNAEYQKLFSKYGFIEYKFNNIGINDGRHEVAKHFHNSRHQYMVFFEDDMLAHTTEGKCKNGFTTKQTELFDKAIQILETEDLDFLKLNFTEFYGDNRENWAWYNLPENKRKEYFPDGDFNTTVFKLGSNGGIPYSVGEHHYCNWPLLFCKRGNYTVFLQEEYAHKFEQTWMSLAMMRMREGKLKAGCLLASPINHNRVYHYKPGTRRENKHYEN